MEQNNNNDISQGQKSMNDEQKEGRIKVINELKDDINDMQLQMRYVGVIKKPDSLMYH